MSVTKVLFKLLLVTVIQTYNKKTAEIQRITLSYTSILHCVSFSMTSFITCITFENRLTMRSCCSQTVVMLRFQSFQSASTSRACLRPSLKWRLPVTWHWSMTKNSWKGIRSQKLTSIGTVGLVLTVFKMYLSSKAPQASFQKSHCFIWKFPILPIFREIPFIVTTVNKCKPH